MNLQIPLPQDLLARYVLVVYSTADGRNGVVMQHALSLKDQQIVLAEGTPVTNDTLKKLREMNQETSLMFIPETVIAQGIGCLAWTHERQNHRLLFQGAHDPAIAALDATLLPQPRLLFIVKNGQLSVYALRGTERPSQSTILYRAPYYNIFNNHTMCVGSVKIPRKYTTAENIDAWVQAFFHSNFVKPADSQKRWAYPGTYRELWDEAQRVGEFNDEWLVSTGKTLGEILGDSKCTN